MPLPKGTRYRFVIRGGKKIRLAFKKGTNKVIETKSFGKAKSKKHGHGEKYRYKVDRKMHAFGDIDEKKKGIIRINPKKGDVVNTIIHEEIHRKYPKLNEKKTQKKADKMESKMSLKSMEKLIRKVRVAARK